MKIETKIPNIPNLNFQYDENRDIILECSGATIISNISQKETIIRNIHVIINENIIISFENPEDEFFFMKKIKEEILEDGKTNSTYIDNFEEYTVKFENTDYDIIINNVYINFSENDYKFKGFGVKIILETKNKKAYNKNFNVWTLIENVEISQNILQKFDDEKLKNIFLKSKNTEEYEFKELHKKLCEKYNNCDFFKDYRGYVICEKNKKNKDYIKEYNESTEESLKQFKNVNSFFYFQTEEKDLEEYDETMKDLEILLNLFEAKTHNLRIKIIRNGIYKKIVINKFNNTKTNGISLIKNFPNNLFNFINSSYTQYIILKENFVDINLLIHYCIMIKNEKYVEVKTLLCSAFFECLTNKKLNQTNMQINTKYQKKNLRRELINRFNELNLDTSKILKIFLPEVDEFFDEITLTFISSDTIGKNKKKVGNIIKNYKKTYVVENLVFYRNRIVHSGNLTVLEIDSRKIIENVYEKKLKKEYNGRGKRLLDEINEFILKNLPMKDFKNTIFRQQEFMEYTIEIFLLRMLNADCLINPNEFDDNNFNSKDYIKQFLN